MGLAEDHGEGDARFFEDATVTSGWIRCPDEKAAALQGRFPVRQLVLLGRCGLRNRLFPWAAVRRNGARATAY